MWGFTKKQVTPAPAEVAGIRVRHSKRARRLALFIDRAQGDVVLTWPLGASEKKVLRFIEKNHGWIAQARARTPRPRCFTPGLALSILNKTYDIIHLPGRGLTRMESDRIVVRGAAAHFSRRLKDFLKEQAKQVLTQKTAEKLSRLGLAPASLRVIDPKTRWGSCSSKGDLMFSWRLVLMPPVVLDYVVAHEVAHRVHMNHSKKFWALCAELSENAAYARDWLKKNGTEIAAWKC